MSTNRVGIPHVSFLMSFLAFAHFGACGLASERLNGSDNVTVNLGAAFASVTIYDPMMGISPTQNLSNVSSVALTLSNHPVIIEIPAQ
jgi:hypothetical protein